MESPLSAAAFRRVLGHYPTGVCVITANLNGQSVGMVVGSFTSVSLEPPLVAFFPNKKSSSWSLIERAGKFCVNVLASDQLSLCRKFASRGGNKFDNVTHRISANGSPILDHIVAWVDCTIYATHDAGDHKIVLGMVADLEVDRPTSPLLFFQGGYGAFSTVNVV